ncbi:MAG TPA: Hpt domain-containing protein [Myxococcota bacterium]|nr:Hpt domain-containing protein [Myxococcota bacterium]
MNLEKYRTLFVDEASDHLQEMARALAALSAGDEPATEAIDTLFRMAHSIKGMAASLDYDAASSLAHKLEDWMEPLRTGAAIDREGLGLVAEAVAGLEEMVACVDETGAPPQPRADLIARLSRSEGRAGTLPALQPAEPTPAAPLKKKLQRPRHRRSPARSVSARRRLIASWPR